jgi:cell division protein FtsB
MPAASTRRAPARPNLPAIRWDRVGRCALLAVFLGIVVLYIGPATKLIQAIGQSKSRNAEVQSLQRENTRLSARKRDLLRPGTMEREARRLGYVKPGERAYVIRDLPK